MLDALGNSSCMFRICIFALFVLSFVIFPQKLLLLFVQSIVLGDLLYWEQYARGDCCWLLLQTKRIKEDSEYYQLLASTFLFVNKVTLLSKKILQCTKIL